MDRSRLEIIHEIFEYFVVSEETSELFVRSTKPQTARSFDRYFVSQWKNFCSSRGVCLYDLSWSHTVNCVALTFNAKKSFSTADGTKSALNSIADIVTLTRTGLQINTQHVQSKVSKAIAETYPKVVRHLQQLDVLKLFAYLKARLSIKDMTEKLLRENSLVCSVLDFASRPSDLFCWFREKTLHFKYGTHNVISSVLGNERVSTPITEVLVDLCFLRASRFRHTRLYTVPYQTISKSRQGGQAGPNS